jgi:hypothetical protein
MNRSVNRHNSITFSACIALSCLLTSCLSSHIPIERSTAPTDSFAIEKTKDDSGIIRTSSADISCREISISDWMLVADYNVFTAQKGGRNYPPDCSIFFFVIKNRSSQTISDISFTMKLKGEIIPSLKIPDIRKRFILGRPGADIEAIFTPRRITEDSLIFKDIDFDQSSLTYPLNFISSGEGVSYFVAFNTPPPDARSFIVTASYTDTIQKKIVDFEMVRTENRPDMQDTKK